MGEGITKNKYGMLRSAVGKTHDLRIPLGFQPIKSALARHSGVQVPVIFRHEGHVLINIGTFRFLPTGLHGLCFGFCFAGPLPLCSLSQGPLLRVHFGESLVIDYTQKSTISTLAVKLTVCQPSFTPGGLPQSLFKWNKVNCGNWTEDSLFILFLKNVLPEEPMIHL